MSQPDSKSSKSAKPVGVLVRKPTTTIYVALLGVAVAALSVGCLFFLAELTRYGFQWGGP